SATVTARNTLIGNNTDASPAGNDFPDCSGALISAGNNLIENITGCAISGNTAGNITLQDPNLAALASNGGPTVTHAFPSGAPPHNAGNVNGCVDHNANQIAADQRGTARAQPTRCDIGALEFDDTAPTVTAILRADPNPTNAPIVHFNVVFSELVTGVAANQFALGVSGVTGASIVGVAGGGASYTVTVATGSGSGTLALAFVSPGPVRDLALNTALASTGGQAYTIDRALPLFANGFE
ncbi:MAG TPA: choice-of-anchor Q domain-containing protein, partial [Xanthomonadales bacterium]|nr:choice-of-anchor Q domain-containing protein [Xanthomonadales bacterium]